MTDVFVFGLESAPDFESKSLDDLASNLQARLPGPLQDEQPVQRQLAPKVARLTYSQSDQTLPTPLKNDSVRDFEKDRRVELVLLPIPKPVSPPSHRPLRLAVFDLDSTLIQQEVIDELAATVGAGEAVAIITERAMRGELDFAASLRARVKLLEGVRADVWDELKTRITFAEGARKLCTVLRRLGVKMAVFSGGFQPMADWVEGELGLDHAVANQLCTAPATDKYPYPHLTGELEPKVPIVTAARKRLLLEEFAAAHDVPLSEALCVGDGANDLDMIRAVGDAGGIGIAFKAKEKVQREASNRLNTSSLADLLYLTGRDEREIRAVYQSEKEG